LSSVTSHRHETRVIRETSFRLNNDPATGDAETKTAAMHLRAGDVRLVERGLSHVLARLRSARAPADKK
jgi:hypothetical protein